MLTTREQEVLGLLSMALTNAQIGHRLHVSAHTVASHLKNMYPKLKVANRAQAAASAVRHGIRGPGE